MFTQKDQSADMFLKKLLDIDNRKVAVDTSNGFITLLIDFRHITDLKEELIQRVFPDVALQFKNHN